MACTDLTREFQCNCFLIKALIQYLSVAERKKVHDWLEKLESTGDEYPYAQIRNEYAAYLLFNVQNGRLLPPFNLMPLCGKLRPLCQVLPDDNTYEDDIKQMKICFCKTPICEEAPKPKPQPLSADPSAFLNAQPRPKKGIIAHVSAFSNYDES